MRSKNLWMRRILAFFIDTLLISLVASFIATPFFDYTSVNNLRENSEKIMVDYENGNITTNDYIDSATSILYRLAQKNGVVTLISLFLSVLYFVIYQFYFNGQTLGKKILGIKVVSNDSKPLTIDNYIYRSFIVNSILFNIITFSFVVFASKEVWLVGISVFGLLNYLVLFICLLMIIFNKDGRGLQDLVGNTKVVLSSE